MKQRKVSLGLAGVAPASGVAYVDLLSEPQLAEFKQHEMRRRQQAATPPR